MKRILCLTLLSALVTANAEVLIYDDFSYPDGNLVVTSGGVWTNHSGSLNDSMVKGGKYEINQGRTDDVNRLFDPVNSQQMLYAGFVLNMSELPSANGTYFAHFKDDSFSYLARLFALSGSAVMPGAYRLGIANVAGTATNVFAMDLATNVDYHVVLVFDTLNLATTLYIDPASDADANISANDAVSGSAAIATMSAFAWRQASGEGVMTVDDLIVGNSFDEVATNAASSPEVAVQPQGATVFSGSDLTLYSLAHGTGQLTYQWRKNANNLSDSGTVSGANGNILSLSGVSGADAGDYDVVISSAYGSITSQVATVEVNTTATAPVITSQPESVTNSVGSSVSFSVTATGSEPLSYQWNFYSTNLPGATSNVLTIPTITGANAGPYFCTVANNNGSRDSAVATLTVLPPLATNIAYLRSLVDTNTWLPTNTTSVFQVDGTVVTFTNITTSANAQFYIQDDTAGIDVFVGGGADVRPNGGDRVRIVGPLSVFNSLLELAPSASNPAHSVTTLSTGNPTMPNARWFIFSQTNDVAVMETVIEGSLVTITNVYFPTGGGGAVFSPNSNVNVTNALGELFVVRIDSRSTNFAGVPMPAFAYQVTGVMGQFQGNTSTPRNAGYQLIVTRPEDIVSTLPPAPTLSITRAGDASTLTWTNTPGSTYSVLGAESLDGPFGLLSFGINSLGSTAGYSETNSVPAAQFYRISSP